MAGTPRKTTPPAKRTRSQVQADLDALTAELETAEDDGDGAELWIEQDGPNGKPVRTKLTGPHAKKWMASLGLVDDDPADDGDPDDPDADADPAPPAGGGGFGGRFFASGKTAPKQ